MYVCMRRWVYLEFTTRLPHPAFPRPTALSPDGMFVVALGEIYGLERETVLYSWVKSLFGHIG